ncbi:hypothetical protein SACE_4529 [Saccharopolyspora erythraea NRRL 2338]|uniref:DUF917 domain-containing protein n=1 Tax=Saccharopolyspora erythraea (strain ATCC 11635 / DSM 40517 / JCM 4748 / NBRC 13426 / NCIMB 8594 / NRRL 2338) TaxID=405948 RepID=A4FIC3_SACEN|nr:hypothetical protein N599_32520 [Saccharopolyspora erythraea D]CAM03798.1 hypothetical protein SACE_4529 [Saccharopolyspora erythraea NRRL 2338]
MERGVSLLGSGGGGDTVTAAALLREQLTTQPGAVLTPVSDLPADALVVPVGVMGATPVFSEKLPVGNEIRAAVRAIEHWTRASIDALVSIEVGGLNGIMPLVAALDLELPLVDADLCGRALPRLDQFSVAAAGNGLAPAALASSGQTLVIAEASSVEVERTARSVLSSAGGWAALALAPIPARELPECAIVGTVGAALALGERALAIGECPEGDALAAATGGRVLGLGRVVEVSRRPGPGEHGRAGFGRGSATVRDHRTGSLLRLEMENEYLLAMHDGDPVASTPDLLAVLDRRTCVPIPCDTIRAGADVAVLQLPAPGFWTDPRRLPLLAPRAFGIDCDPILLEGTR